MAAAQQPNLANLAAGMQRMATDLNIVSQEAALFSNIPAVAGGNAILQQLAGIQQQLQNIAATALANHNALTTTVTNNHNTAVANHNALTATVNANHHTAQQNQAANAATLAELTTYMQNGPMRAANAVALISGPLHGPNGPLPAPITSRDALVTATAASLNALNTHLGGLTGYPTAGTVAQKREAIAHYLGVTL